MTIASPIDDFVAPEQLVARVVSPEPRPRLHGYDVQDDLVRNYDFAELIYTALVGRPPQQHEGRALNILLGFLLPICVSEAPSHGAMIARMCDAQTQRVVATAAAGLCEQARFHLVHNAPLLEWLDHGRVGDPPSTGDADDPAQREATARLHQQLRAAGLAVDPREESLALLDAIVSGLFTCGVTLGWQRETLWCLARLPAAAAEAMAASPGSFGQYPMRQPPFEFVEEPSR